MGKILLESKIIVDKYCEYIFNNYDIQNRDITTTEVPLPSHEDMEEMNFIKEFAQRIIYIDNKKVISDASVNDTFNTNNENLKEFLKDIK